MNPGSSAGQVYAPICAHTWATHTSATSRAAVTRAIGWRAGAVVPRRTRSAARGQEPAELGHHVPTDRVVDVSLLLAALDEAGAPERREVVRQRGPGDLQGLLELAGRHLGAAADEQEEQLEARL